MVLKNIIYIQYTESGMYLVVPHIKKYIIVLYTAKI